MALSVLVGGVASARPDADAGQWIDRRLLPAERALLERSVGSAPAAFDASTKWLTGTAVSWAELRGRVVILQSFTSNDAGRSALTRLNTFMGRADPAKLAAFAVHTPEHSDRAAAFVGGSDLKFPVAFDPVGSFCDDMGIWKTPTIILIDRQGVVRAAGVSMSKLQVAVDALLSEPFDAAAPPPKTVAARDASAPEKPLKNKPKEDYPKASARGGATNLIGKPGPPLAVQTWLTDQPETKGKVVVVDFWATWCGPCRASIPHMNELAAKFKDSVVAVGLSDEDAGVIRAFMKKSKMQYAVATDPGGRMSQVTRHQGIPFVIVMSPDGVVRWQGHPMSLDEATLRQIVEASAPAVPAGEAEEMRWVTKSTRP